MQVHVESANPENPPLELPSSTMELRDIRDGALVALDGIIQKQPHEKTWSCPAIWVDGRGTVREIDIKSPDGNVETVINGDASLIQTMIHDRAVIIRREHDKNRRSTQGCHHTFLAMEKDGVSKTDLLFETLLDPTDQW
jgi:hypothetical protein